ncbi:MAG: CapA family protein [Butyrivibrio sp.]|nr:CapA family protein [Butyrivibrio sp.]
MITFIVVACLGGALCLCGFSFASAKEPMRTSDKSDITIVMVGDILLHEPIEEAAKDENGNYNYDFIFAGMKDEISAADIAIVNQEVIIGGKELGVSGYPSFNAAYEAGDALVGAGFDVVCHGTNHALDKGKNGVVNCVNYWKTRHPEIAVVGINGSEAEYSNVTIVEKKGVQIAVLNYTYDTNGIPQPSDMPHAIDMMDKDKVIADLQYAEENADFTIVCPHWGTEYRLTPDAYQEYWTGIFRKYGADLVIGTHPHVIEPVTMLKDGNSVIVNNHGGGDMLVYYSLGNFVSWTSSLGKGVANRSVGGMATVTIGFDNKDAGAAPGSASGAKPRSEVVIRNYGVRALVCHLQEGPGGAVVYPLSEYTDSLGEVNAIKAQDTSFSRQYCVDLCNKVWCNGWK